MVVGWPRTIVAVNVGGTIISTVPSIYFLVRSWLYGRGPLGLFLAAIVVRHMAHSVKGIGIAEPALMSPLVVPAVAPLLSRRSGPPMTYVSGSLGTLIGADLLHLGKIEGLGAPIVSIGGTGPFDGSLLDRNTCRPFSGSVCRKEACSLPALTFIRTPLRSPLRQPTENGNGQRRSYGDDEEAPRHGSRAMSRPGA